METKIMMIMKKAKQRPNVATGWAKKFIKHGLGRKLVFPIDIVLP